MHRGSVSLGDVQCHNCHRIIPYPERYLLLEDKDDVTERYCITCCLEKGYVHTKVEKKEKVFTFFPEA